MNKNLKFADRLLLLRREMGLTQSAFADKMHITRAYLSQIETGREPSPALQDLFTHLETEWQREKKKMVQEIAAETPTQSEFSTPLGASLTRDQVGTYHVGGGRAFLKNARIAAGFTQKELAEKVGYSLSIYQNIEDGSSNMSRKMAAKVANVLGCNVEALLNGADEPPARGQYHGTVGETPDIELAPGQKARYVPLLSMAQCGGMELGGMVAWDDGAYTHEGFVAVNPKDPNTFAVTLAGDSMTPVFSPGDVAIIYPNTPPHNGGVALVKLLPEYGDSVMCKLFHQSGQQVTLSSYNPAHPPITYQRKDFAWIYHVHSVNKVYPS